MHRWKNTIVMTLMLTGLWGTSAIGQVTGDDLLQDARDSTRAQTEQAEQDIWTRSVVRRFENRVAESVTLFEELEKRHNSLTQWMQSLLSNEDGKRLALNPTAGMQFLAYQEQPVFRLSDLTAKKELLQSLRSFLQQTGQQSATGYVPDATRVGQADDMYLWARDRLGRIAEIEAWLKSTLAEVDLDANVAEAPTLQQAIDAYLVRRHQLWVDEMTAGRLAAEQAAAPQIAENARVVELERALFDAERLRREAMQQLEKERIDFERRIRDREVTLQEQLAAAKRDYEERLAEIARRNRVAEAERGRRDVQADVRAREIEENARRLDLVAQCQSAVVQRDLKPFLAEGLWQPGDRELNARIDRKPMSLSALRSVGALNPDVQGLQALLAVANTVGSDRAGMEGVLIEAKRYRHMDTDRPKWSYNREWTKLTSEQVQEVRRIQSLLIELGEVMAEEGMLAR